MFKFTKRFFNKNLVKSQLYTGFTLAEVLITLGIIGIVAALTIPTLISDYQKNVIISKLKKVYSAFSQLNTTIIKDNGSYEEFGTAYSLTDMNSTFDNYIKPNMKILKDCGNTPGDCWANAATKDLWSTSTSSLHNSTYTRYFMLSDGTSIAAYLGSAGELEIWFDINGPSGKNTFARDVFGLWLENSKVYTRGDDYNDTQILNFTTKPGTGGTGTSNAFTRIIRDGWQINFY